VKDPIAMTGQALWSSSEVFARLLRKYYGGERDDKNERLLGIEVGLDNSG
jgi:hypothetical protein